MPERKPQPAGVLDPKLGVSNKRAICETCNQGLAECTGHFGARTRRGGRRLRGGGSGGVGGK